jgi:2'-5' RNA ligase
MKATIVLLADNETSNTASRLLLDANEIGKLGYELTRLPFHVSLKQPFSIKNISEFEKFFDKYSKQLRPVEVHFKELIAWKSSVFGLESGVLVLKAEKTRELSMLHENLNKKLEEELGLCKADFDGDAYSFHMTISLGNKPYSEYEKVASAMRDRSFDFTALFSELGLFYYEGDTIELGKYFCYKRVSIR